MKNFRLYGETFKGWEKIDLKNCETNLEKVHFKAENLNPDKYLSYMIIEHDFEKDCDTPIDRGKVKKKTRKKF